MRNRLLMMGISTVFTVNIGQATLYPVTGDTSTIWNAIDLLPAEKNNVNLNTAAQGGRQPATDTVAPAPAASEPAAAPPAPAASQPEVAPPAPATAPVEKAGTPPAAPPAINQPPSTPPAATAAPAATKSKPVSTQKSQKTSQTPAVSKPPETTAKQKASVDTTGQPADTSAVTPGTLIITSFPDSAQIIINDVSVGITPYHATGFYPGIYEITLQREGYEPFRKTVDLKENGTEFVTGTLQQESGYLYVASVPPNAAVLLNDTAIGVTPLHSKPLKPGIYRLRVELPEYTPYTEQLGITPKLTDTIQITLLPLKKPGFAGKLNLRKSRNVRRIAFGAVGVAAAASGLFLNLRTVNNLADEQKALDKYMAPEKSTSEYDQLYYDYLDATKITDNYVKARNICYTIGIIAGVGFALSIPF